MSEKAYFGELERALARPDAARMCQQLDAYARYYENGMGDWPDGYADSFGEIISCYHDDPRRRSPT